MRQLEGFGQAVGTDHHLDSVERQRQAPVEDQAGSQYRRDQAQEIVLRPQ